MNQVVLARKWRPRVFADLIGQEQIARALRYALAQQRLHHAWLFTGTRGVGKTTLARILAKCLNCTANNHVNVDPCGLCQPCRETEQTCFIDYIELDAASHRGVEEISQLLEQARYAPAPHSRFKIFVIDEVHMLTHHAFNALLKILEEPPAHLKFILATTDVQKIPATVQSRCLAFHLTLIPAAKIQTHLIKVLDAEGIAFDQAAIQLLAQAAQGSMRDALSLLEQAIAYGCGAVLFEHTKGMLGELDSAYLFRLLQALADNNAQDLIRIADEIQTLGIALKQVLLRLSRVLHQIALVQAIPDLSLNSGDQEAINHFAQLFSPEDVQMFYQMTNLGCQDFDLAPDEYAGFTMTLLRILLFQPKLLDQVAIDDEKIAVPGLPSAVSEQKQTHPEPNITKTVEGGSDEAVAVNPGNWPLFVKNLPIHGLTKQLAIQSELLNIETTGSGEIHLHLRASSSYSVHHGVLRRFENILSDYWGQETKLTLVPGNTTQSAQQLEASRLSQQQQFLQQRVQNDPFVKDLVTELDVELLPDSIQPLS